MVIFLSTVFGFEVYQPTWWAGKHIVLSLQYKPGLCVLSNHRKEFISFESADDEKLCRLRCLSRVCECVERHIEGPYVKKLWYNWSPLTSDLFSSLSRLHLQSSLSFHLQCDSCIGKQSVLYEQYCPVLLFLFARTIVHWQSSRIFHRCTSEILSTSYTDTTIF